MRSLWIRPPEAITSELGSKRVFTKLHRRWGRELSWCVSELETGLEQYTSLHLQGWDLLIQLPGFGMYVWTALCVQYASGIFFWLYNIKQIPKSLQSKWRYNNFSSKWETANTLPKLNWQFMLQWIVLGLMRQRSKSLSRQILSKILKQATTAVMTKYVQTSKESRHDCNILWYMKNT